MSEINEDVVVILAAAGSATRFQNSSPENARISKTFISIDEVPVWQYSVRQFRSVESVGQILMTVAPDMQDEIRTRYDEYLRHQNVHLVVGGRERWLSIRKALELVSSSHAANPSRLLVAIHDAARPCIGQTYIQNVIAKARETGAAILGQPVWGTVKRTDHDSKIIETVSREHLFQATTPQVARLDWLLEAYSAENVQRASQQGTITDDAQLLAIAGYPVHLCVDASSNIKITTFDDLNLATFFLRGQ
jgi:2-C-methyl-D-erythritol 4-phosphate cytidylyltransferase